MNFIINKSWLEIFDTDDLEFIKKELVKEKENFTIYPKEDDIFNVFNLLDFENVRVVILGQDPYINENEANGIAFSVPKGTPYPPSLKNIFRNLLKYHHINKLPESGDLLPWVKQGVLLMNASLTTRADQSNSHFKIWIRFTNKIIRNLSSKRRGLIFVLWGTASIDKEEFIDKTKHMIIRSSHPSPYSYNKEARGYPSFGEIDHFGIINKHLKVKIDWNT